mgnify:CR=1 FL=1
MGGGTSIDGDDGGHYDENGKPVRDGVGAGLVPGSMQNHVGGG